MMRVFLSAAVALFSMLGLANAGETVLTLQNGVAATLTFPTAPPRRRRC